MPTVLGKALGTALGKSLGTEPGSTSLEAPVLALSPYSFPTSDYYAMDEGSGKTASFLDWVPAGTGIKAIDPTHAYSQPTSANQVAAPGADALFGGRVSASFSGTEYYNSTAPASAWKFLHDGTGFDAIFVASANTAAASGTAHTFASTMDIDAFPTSIGSTFRFAAQTGRLSLVVARNNATATINTSFPVGGGWVNDSARYARFTYVEGGSPEYAILDKSTTITSGSSAAAPDTGNPTQTLRLGAEYGAGFAGLRAKWVAAIFFTRVLSAGDWSVVQTYLQTKYGIAP